MTRTWPQDWEARRNGDDCPFCAEGRPSERDGGVRFFEGAVSDAYVQREDHSPFAGVEVTGWPVATLVRGTPMLRDGEVAKDFGGRYLDRNPEVR